MSKDSKGFDFWIDKQNREARNVFIPLRKYAELPLPQHKEEEEGSKGELDFTIDHAVYQF